MIANEIKELRERVEKLERFISTQADTVYGRSVLFEAPRSPDGSVGSWRQGKAPDIPPQNPETGNAPRSDPCPVSALIEAFKDYQVPIDEASFSEMKKLVEEQVPQNQLGPTPCDEEYTISYSLSTGKVEELERPIGTQSDTVLRFKSGTVIPLEDIREASKFYSDGKERALAVVKEALGSDLASEARSIMETIEAVLKELS